MNKTELVRQYRRKYPDMPSLKLARIIYNDNNILFNSVETVRSLVRKIEGKIGQRKIHTTNKEFYMSEARPKNPYKLPESHQEKRDPFILPKGCDNILLISDIDKARIGL